MNKDKQSSNNTVLLIISIIGIIVSILPIALISPAVAIGLLTFNIICLALTIKAFAESRRTTNLNQSPPVASLVLNIIATTFIVFYLLLIFVIGPSAESAASKIGCDLQTTIDLNECPEGYELKPNQTLKQE